MIAFDKIEIWCLRMFLVLIAFFQISIIPVYASSANLGFNPHSPVLEIYTYDEIENSSWVEVRKRRVFSKSETGSEYEVLAGVASVAAKGRMCILVWGR
ncbi:hypothetical protein [Algoriphagus sp. Y33]|uniref:hypothetical protein n=1 Tax=Algoriphagus sp. Y33 TaxID=2772483 RepID=UPI0017805B98|nr:hypothetical protein [Algoriphagus sp. Y33]